MRPYELSLYWGAAEHLQELGVDVNSIKIKDIEEHIRKLTADRKQQISSFKTKENEYKELKLMSDSYEKYLNESNTNRLLKSKKPEHLL